MCAACHQRALRAVRGRVSGRGHQGEVLPRECDVCAETGKIVRFTLKRSVLVGGRWTSRTSGGISLCQRCWKQCRNRNRASLSLLEMQAVA